jgi:hypothetical protein
MKKIIFLMVLLMVFTFTGCSSSFGGFGGSNRGIIVQKGNIGFESYKDIFEKADELQKRIDSLVKEGENDDSVVNAAIIGELRKYRNILLKSLTKEKSDGFRYVSKTDVSPDDLIKIAKAYRIFNSKD